ncbi:MAG: hypothetical protein JW795_13315 [Chitinivibrionales bacterium]|nr:hypothetical protein [Chitinivibrionales bacterium]
MIGKWLNAGVFESGSVHVNSQGTTQGGVISPMICNVYMHEVLDTWFENEIRHRLSARARLFRWADDFIIVFEREEDARRVMAVLPKRFERYGLQLHPQKSKIVPFKRPRFCESIGEAQRRGWCATFNFLGFTHCWHKSRKGYWIVRQLTAKDRFSRSVKAVRAWCRQWRHLPVKEQHKILCSKLRGHYNYYGVTGNMDRLNRFLLCCKLQWKKWLSRRSQKGRMNWEKFACLLKHFPLPSPKIVHSYGSH